MEDLSNSIKISFYEKQIESLLKDKILTFEIIEYGLPFIIFKNIVNLNLINKEIWPLILEIQPETLKRYEKSENYKLNSKMSEKVLTVTALAIEGKDVFNGSQKFNAWLKSPHKAIKGFKPITLLKNSIGREIIMKELNAIKYGVLT